MEEDSTCAEGKGIVWSGDCPRCCVTFPDETWLKENNPCTHDGVSGICTSREFCSPSYVLARPTTGDCGRQFDCCLQKMDDEYTYPPRPPPGATEADGDSCNDGFCTTKAACLYRYPLARWGVEHCGFVDPLVKCCNNKDQPLTPPAVPGPDGKVMCRYVSGREGTCEFEDRCLNKIMGTTLREAYSPYCPPVPEHANWDTVCCLHPDAATPESPASDPAPEAET